MNVRAPAMFDVRLETSKGPIVIAVHRDWAPHGADRFYNLVRAGYYDGARFFRVIRGRWAQFGINGDPRISNAWRTRTFPDDPRRVSNARGTVAFAFAVPDGRATQVFINLRDNSAALDAEAFAPFGAVVQGMDVADALDAEYAEAAGAASAPAGRHRCSRRATATSNSISRGWTTSSARRCCLPPRGRRPSESTSRP